MKPTGATWTKVVEVYQVLAADQWEAPWLTLDSHDGGGELRAPEALQAEVWARIEPLIGK